MEELQAYKLILKGIISELPEEAKYEYEKAYKELKQVLNSYGEAGSIALAVLGTEVAEK